MELPIAFEARMKTLLGEHYPDMLGELLGRIGSKGLPVDTNLAAQRGLESCHSAHQSGLAHPIGTNQAGKHPTRQ